MRKRTSRIDEIYDYCSENNLPMLSNYNGDFWEVYVANYTYFDRLFMKTYRKFTAFGNLASGTDEQVVATNAVDFILDVGSWLRANSKRYSELYRLQAVSDTDYNILDNYNVTETHDMTTLINSTDNIGSRTDTKSGSIAHGAVSESDSNSYTHGAVSETDSKTNSYGLDKITTEVDTVYGAQANTEENTVSADNVSSYSPKDYSTTNLGTHTDSVDTTETRQAHSDSESGTHTEASRTDSESKSHTENARTDTTSDTNIYGSHTDTHSEGETVEKSVRKSGNMGIYSYSKLLSEHNDLWTAFNFYKLVFDEIAEEFLRIVY